MWLRKSRGVEIPPHCAKCGQETAKGHSYCLGCATIRRYDLRNARERERRRRALEADWEAADLRK